MGWQSEFDDIRPYSDSELPSVLRRIRRNRWLISGIRRMRAPKCPDLLKPFAHGIIRLDLWRTLRRFDTIDEFQRKIIVDRVLNYVIKKTTAGLTWSGTDQFTRGGAYLFISNHRDIVLDSAFVNYSLAKSGLDIAEIAFGDNLLTNEFVSDLIRINKSFIVYRNLSIREKAKAAFRLSRYIHQARNHGNSIWMSQREGRAKDGNDLTNPSILKMLFLSARRDGMKFVDFVETYPIVPVSISYEFDPCDRFKARELQRQRTNGSYQKRHSEDLMSMYVGLVGEKGRVHISFGTPLDKPDNIKAAIVDIDRQIFSSYRLWPSNRIAYDAIHPGKKYSGRYTQEEERFFRERFRKETDSVRRVAFEIYAATVVNHLAAGA